MQASQEKFNIEWENIFTPLSRKLKSWLKESWTKTFPNFFPKFDKFVSPKNWGIRDRILLLNYYFFAFV
jgi:hypothetical protein